MSISTGKHPRFDFSMLMPKIARKSKKREACGNLYFENLSSPGKLNLKSDTVETSYYAEFYWPSDDTDQATCVLTFVYEQPRVILLVGNPDGFGSYVWRAACPHTMHLTQILVHDSGTDLFVSPACLGRPAPPSVRRLEDLTKIYLKAFEKYGKFDLLKRETVPEVKEDNDFALIDDLQNFLLLDGVFAMSGYPFAVRDSENRIDVLATMSQFRTRRRLPAHLLLKNRWPKAPTKFARLEEMIAAMRERRIRIPDEHLIEERERAAARAKNEQTIAPKPKKIRR
jgi:hypothetical protein